MVVPLHPSNQLEPDWSVTHHYGVVLLIQRDDFHGGVEAVRRSQEDGQDPDAERRDESDGSGAVRGLASERPRDGEVTLGAQRRQREHAHADGHVLCHFREFAHGATVRPRFQCVHSGCERHTRQNHQQIPQGETVDTTNNP